MLAGTLYVVSSKYKPTCNDQCMFTNVNYITVLSRRLELSAAALIPGHFHFRVLARAQRTGAIALKSLGQDHLNGLTSLVDLACGSTSPLRARGCHSSQ